MAEKRIITGVIDSIEERLPDNSSGWGKYKVYISGHKGIIQADVPADVNAEFDLEEGMTVTLKEGPYKGWIVHSKSECFTGEPYEAAEVPRASTPKRASNAPKGNPYKKSSYGDSNNNGTTVVATPRSGNTHTAWNDYQINTRDPHMRMQALLKIATEVHCTCIENDCDPGAVMNEIMKDASMLDQAVQDYLKD